MKGPDLSQFMMTELKPFLGAQQAGPTLVDADYSRTGGQMSSNSF
jgi:hypothetical protein